jgi:putative DNA primase/helicase
LPRKLLAELPGILNWALEGCMAWQARGLEPPPLVADASNEYREEQDRIGTFLEDCCEVTPEHPDRTTSASDLYGVYGRWCESNGCGRLSQPRFKEKLLERRLVQKRLEKGLRWLGVTINDDWQVGF